MAADERTAGDAPNGRSFEESLKTLERLVAEMERGDLPLDAMMARFEEGRRLVAFCTAELETIRRRIDKVTSAASGATEPLA